MTRIFITGSSDGLGQLAANALISEGHEVILHARNSERARYAMEKAPGAEKVLIADLSGMEETKRLADEVNAMGRFDAVIHNAGVYRVPNKLIFAVNTLAPYILTCLIQKPKRLIYISSGLHLYGNPNMEISSFESGSFSYADSKLHVVILAKILASKWPDVYANAVNPGWVPTKMGGPGAPDSLEEGYLTQTWLAVSNDKDAMVSGRYFYHKKEKHYSAFADDVILQEKFLSLCERISGVSFQL